MENDIGLIIVNWKRDGEWQKNRKFTSECISPFLFLLATLVLDRLNDEDNLLSFVLIL